MLEAEFHLLLMLGDFLLLAQLADFLALYTAAVSKQGLDVGSSCLVNLAEVI